MDRSNTPLEIIRVIFSIIFTAMTGKSRLIVVAGNVANFAPDGAKAKLAAISTFDTIDRKSAIDYKNEEGLISKISEGHTILKNAEFSYPLRPNIPVLRGLDMEALPGTTVAFVGQSGWYS